MSILDRLVCRSSMEATFSRPSATFDRTEIRPTRRRWAGRVLSGLAVTFLSGNAILQLTQHPEAVKASIPLGISAHTLPTIGLVTLVASLLYAIPRTARVGAILLTGLLGGAVFTHLRVDDPLFSHTLFPLYVGSMVWGGLALRDPRIANLLLAR